MIVVMAIAMVSLILVQMNSINKALQIKRDQFDQAVMNALLRVVEKLEREEMASLQKQFSYQETASVWQYSKRRTNNNLFPGTITEEEFGISVTIPMNVNRKQDKVNIGNEQISPKLNNERGHPGEYPSAFDKLDKNSSFLNQQYNDRIMQQMRYFEFNDYKLQVASLNVEERLDLRDLDANLKGNSGMVRLNWVLSMQ